ncbi:hypothetical protein V8E53_000400 [Lactarius tabidus]
MMSNHWHLLRRAAIALIGSTVLVWHALACSQPGLSKQMHSLPSYNPYSCPCYPDNHTGDLLLTPCSATTGCWFRPFSVICFRHLHLPFSLTPLHTSLCLEEPATNSPWHRRHLSQTPGVQTPISRG